MNIRGKVAIVTGASSGIGREIAFELARRGASLVLAARRLDAIEKTADVCRTIGSEAVAIVTDVTDTESCSALAAAALERFGRIDVLVNNAGFALFDEAGTAAVEDIESMINTNYLGAVRCTEAVLPSMIARREGVIANIASIAGLMGFFRMSGYCASKFALVGYSEAIRDELMRHGISVVIVCPGTTETEFFVKAERGKMPAASRLILSISPERVAKAAVRAIERRSYRVIVPWTAALFMRLKEIAPMTAHWLMRNVSRALERKS